MWHFCRLPFTSQGTYNLYPVSVKHILNMPVARQKNWQMESENS